MTAPTPDEIRAARIAFSNPTGAIYRHGEVLVREGGSSVGLKLKCQDIGKKDGFVVHFKKVIGAL